MKPQSKPKKVTIKVAPAIGARDGFAVDTEGNAKTITSYISLLMAVTYKNGRIYVRRIMKDIFLWDAVFNGELFSSYFVITPKPGQDKLSEDEVAEVLKMCYSGAAATIDYQRGDRLPETDEKIVKRFEEARKQVDRTLN